MLIKNKDPLVSLLYSLLRDYVQPGDLEGVVMDIEKHGSDTVYSNGYLANYAISIVKRLKKIR